jgi:hypothetical protein
MRRPGAARSSPSTISASSGATCSQSSSAVPDVLPRFLARARTAVGAERTRLWALMTELAPVYHRYAAVSAREIPVVVLERVPASGR